MEWGVVDFEVKRGWVNYLATYLPYLDWIWFKLVFLFWCFLLLLSSKALHLDLGVFGELGILGLFIWVGLINMVDC